MRRSRHDIIATAKAYGIYSETFGPDKAFKFEEIGGDAWESLARFLIGKYIKKYKGITIRVSKSSEFSIGFIITVYDNGYMIKYYIY